MNLFRRLLTLGHRWVHRALEASPQGGALAEDNIVWIAWEVQRRTTELASCLGVPLERYLYRGPGALRYPVLAGHTWECLVRRRPDILIVQNPSLILTVVACFARMFLGVRLVVDRHTNFMLNQPPSWRKRFFTTISEFTLRRADLTIVTNSALVEVVEAAGGHGFMLPDRIPDLQTTKEFAAGANAVVLFICTYAKDEPWQEVLKVAHDLGADVQVFVTGNSKRASWTPELEALRDGTPNLTLTGFLDEADYMALLHRADVIMDLTTFDHCLVCGAYEGVAAGKALVLSDKEANRELFGDVPVYVDADAQSIQSGLRLALAEATERAERVVAFRGKYVQWWETRLTDLVTRVYGS